jgi:diguanylate cyclase (GGDEF)-like protein
VRFANIDGDLKRIERRDSYLWFLALGLLVVLGLAIVVDHATTLDSVDSITSRSTALRALGALLFLIPLFCLYVMRIRLANGTMKSLLVEMHSMAAASRVDLDTFLSSIAHKIAAACSVRLCQIAIVPRGRPALALQSASVDGWSGSAPHIGRTYALAELPLCRQAIETLRPVVLTRSDVERIPAGGAEAELLTGGSKEAPAVLIVPMAAEDGPLGVIILAGPKRLLARGFRSSTIVIAHALAAHAAAAVYQSTLKQEAIHDPLTQLYNRRHFSDRLKKEIIRADREGHVMALMICDLNHFKAINDTMGHQVGDEVLKLVGTSLRESTRGTDLVFRWGGDEFVVILSKSSREGGLIAAARIREGVLGAAKLAKVDVDVSIGIALYPDHGVNEDELVRVADRALYAAKKTGAWVNVGEYEVSTDSVRVVFQPVVEIPSNEVMGYEALSRDAEGKLTISELFEKHRAVGTVSELKRMILKRQVQVAHELGLPRVFVNVDFEVLSKLDPFPRPHGLDVVLELSELEALQDLEHCLAVAGKWREHGYRFAIDDFGAGFISLPFLAMLVPDYVKLDRSTLLQAVSSDKFRNFLRSMLHAVRAYASSGIIAEGIETETELQLAHWLELPLVQGFLLGAPQELGRLQEVESLVDVDAVHSRV